MSNINSLKLSILLDHHNHSNRNKLKEVFRHPIFVPRYNIALEKERQLAYDRLKLICNSGIISVKDFWFNPRNIFAVHELAGMIDGSMATKLTVQFNLFGGTILKLGTEIHHQILESIDKLEKIGCFALTELAYGILSMSTIKYPISFHFK